MSVPIDLLILGGGIQGLALLREFSEEFSTLLVGDDDRVSESLHFHGYFSSGWNAASLDAARIYHRTAADWHRRLRKDGLSPQQCSFHAALSPEAVEELQTNWQQAGIAAVEEPFPPPFELDGLPSHRVYRFDDDLVFDGAAALASLREPVADRIRIGRAVGFQRQDNRIAQVTVQLGDQSLQLKPAAVLSACGAGNARILEMLKVANRTVREAQLVRPMHMILARGRRLPAVSGFLLDLVVVYHPFDGQEGLWIVTLNPIEPTFTAGVVDMSRDPDVDTALVRTSLEKLAAVIPDFDQLAADCRWDVYVGWKTDAPGPAPSPLLKLEYPLPYDVRDFGLENLWAVWPNHWCLATPAAAAAGRAVRQKLEHNYDWLDIPGQSSLKPDSLRDKWARSDRPWTPWDDFARRFGFSRRAPGG